MVDDETLRAEGETAAPMHAPRVLDIGALRALAHPLRVEIYDLLSQYGPQTASSLAEMTGESTGATSYHLRELAKHELIHEIEGRGSARERWWRRPPQGVAVGGPEQWSSPAGRAVSELVVGEFAARRHQQMMRYITDAMTQQRDWDEAAILSTTTARLTLEQLTELTTKVQGIIDETVDAYRDQTGDGVRPITIRADIFPLPDERH